MGSLSRSLVLSTGRTHGGQRAQLRLAGVESLWSASAYTTWPASLLLLTWPMIDASLTMRASRERRRAIKPAAVRSARRDYRGALWQARSREQNWKIREMKLSAAVGATMATEPNLTLREVVRRLSRIRGLPKRKRAIADLLGLLRAGELSAGFEFPASSVVWIPIPKQYWVGVSSQKFRSLRYSPDDDRDTGTYEVRITAFIEEYIDVISQKIKATATDQVAASLEELQKALSASNRRYEVAITAAEWTKYLEIHQIQEPVLHETRGRHPKTSWHHLAPIIAAYMMTLEKRPQSLTTMIASQK